MFIYVHIYNIYIIYHNFIYIENDALSYKNHKVTIIRVGGLNSESSFEWTTFNEDTVLPNRESLYE